MALETHPCSPKKPPSSAPAERVEVSVLLGWRQDMLRLGGEPSSFDWLLDGAGGLNSWQLRSLLIQRTGQVDLRCSRSDIERLWRRHLAEFVPLQYLMGRCWWRNFELAVGPSVLIPRPETEQMIDLALAKMQKAQQLESPDMPSSTVWADLGTGSGCLAMGLAQALPTSEGLAVDISPAALSQAHQNLRQANLLSQVRLIEGHWFEPLRPWWGHIELVVANPPYIPSQEIEDLDPIVRDHEPRLALDGGNDGLSALEQIAKQAPIALAPGGFLVVEHHHNQSEQVLQLLATHGLVDGAGHRDLEGQKRFASARKP